MLSIAHIILNAKNMLGGIKKIFSNYFVKNKALLLNELGTCRIVDAGSTSQLQTHVGGFLEPSSRCENKIGGFCNEGGEFSGLWENPWREKLVQLGFYDQPYYGPIIVFPIDDDGKRMNADDAFVSQFLDYEKTLSAEMTYIFDH